jgi:transcriptional regulator with XRE-family HTH domain
MHISDEGHTRLGAKLRELRRQRRLSVRTLAAQAGFSASFISQLESDAVSPSIASLEKIAGALGVTLGQFFSELEYSAAARVIIRRREWHRYTSTWSNSTVAVLADAAPERRLSAVAISIDPGGMSSRQPEVCQHDTFALVEAGILTLIYEGGEEALETGDSAYLLKGATFAWMNRSPSPALLLLIAANERATLAHDVLALDQASTADS